MATTQVPSTRRPQPGHDTLRRRLERSRDECEAELRQSADVDPDHAADPVHETYRANVDLLLYDTERALRRLEDGTYGRCLGCGDMIPQARLELVPQAACCVACAQHPARRR